MNINFFFSALKFKNKKFKKIKTMVYSFIEIIIFIFGLCIGSFINVCIYRLPISKSIVHPGSLCPNCKKPIRFYDNIPVLSYFLLRGRCRHCSTPISCRYPLIELISGFFALFILSRFGLIIEGLIYYVFIASLIIITFVDIDHKIIPDVITIPGMLVFFVLASFGIPAMTYKDSIIGLLAGGGSLLAVAWTYHLITQKNGMGGGDIKLLAMIGTIVGWQGVIFTIFVASAAGTLVGILMMFRTQQSIKLAIPFGPFLSIGAVGYIFFGSKIIFWYFDIFGA